MAYDNFTTHPGPKTSIEGSQKSDETYKQKLEVQGRAKFTSSENPLWIQEPIMNPGTHRE